MQRKGNPSTLLVTMQNNSAAIENSTKTPQKIKNRTTYDPTIPLLTIYVKELKSGPQRCINTLMFIAALFTIIEI